MPQFTGCNIKQVNIHQQDLPFEKYTERITVVFTKSDQEKLARLAEKRGYRNVGPLVRDLVNLGMKFERYQNLTVKDILK